MVIVCGVLCRSRRTKPISECQSDKNKDNRKILARMASTQGLLNLSEKMFTAEFRIRQDIK